LKLRNIYDNICKFIAENFKKAGTPDQTPKNGLGSSLFGEAAKGEPIAS
jgi:hypothetical protein